jgi:hypothetical protein
MDFSTYNQNTFSKAVTLYNFPDEYNNPVKRSMALRFLFTHYDAHSRGTPYYPTKEDMERKLHSMFNEFFTKRDKGYQQALYELADIATTFVPRLEGILLEVVRGLDAEIVEEKKEGNRVINQNQPIRPVGRLPAPNPPKNVYTDTQNVHNSNINKSVNEAVVVLYNKYKDEFILEMLPEDARYDYKLDIAKDAINKLKNKFSGYTDVIDTVFKFFKENTGLFATDKVNPGISLLDTFICVWLWIQERIIVDPKAVPIKLNTELENELHNRTIEEFKEMKGKCTTGHLSRLVNIIQGFTTDSRLKIKLNEKEELEMNINNYLTKELSSCRDEKVIDGILDTNPSFVNFIKVRVANKILEWLKDYANGENKAEVLKQIARTANKYAGVEIFGED